VEWLEWPLTARAHAPATVSVRLNQDTPGNVGPHRSEGSKIKRGAQAARRAPLVSKARCARAEERFLGRAARSLDGPAYRIWPKREFDIFFLSFYFPILFSLFHFQI
jgi:hypothetical protein